MINSSLIYIIQLFVFFIASWTRISGVFDFNLDRAAELANISVENGLTCIMAAADAGFEDVSFPNSRKVYFWEILGMYSKHQENLVYGIHRIELIE